MTGRPVDVEIVPKAHALLSASSAERWLTCTPSARIEEALEDEGSAFATDGTAAHALAELDRRRLPWAWVTGDGNERLENALGAVKAAGLR